jgi:hypothetical protein
VAGSCLAWPSICLKAALSVLTTSAPVSSCQIFLAFSAQNIE